MFNYFNTKIIRKEKNLNWTAVIVGRLHAERITQRELARELDVTEEYVSAILNGKREPVGIRERMDSAIDSIVARKLNC